MEYEHISKFVHLWDFSGSLSSPAFGNKPGHAGLHHDVEPDLGPNRVANLLHGVFRQGRNLKVLLDTAGLSR